MPIPSLELPKIPSSAIMDLRSKNALAERYELTEQTSERHRILRESIGALAYGRKTSDRLEALDLGIRVGSVLDEPYEGPDMRAPVTEESLRRMARRLMKYAEMHSLKRQTLLDRAYAKLDVRAPQTANAFDAVVMPHVDGNLKHLLLARQGAAMVRCASFQIDFEAYNSAVVSKLPLKADA